MRVLARFAVRAAAVAAVCCLFAGRAMAYVDLAPTLGRVVNDAKSIALVEVQSFDAATQTVMLKPVQTLKGDPLTEPIANRVAPPDGMAAPAIRRWAGVGSRGIWFSTKSTALVCIGTSWYQQKKAGDSWKLGVDRPDLALAYCGSVRQLSDSIATMLAGKSAVLTAVVYGATDVDTSFDLALGRNTLPGLARVQRINGSLNMASMVMAAASSGYVIGPGATNPADLPKLRQSLKASDATAQANSAESIGHLGHDGQDAADDLKPLLADATPAVRSAAAGALLRVGGPNAEAIDVLQKELAATDAGAKRGALNAVALAGKPAVELASSVMRSMTDADESVRATAIATFTTLGPDVPTAEATRAVAVLVPMLDDVRWRVEAADALGRLGKHARPVPPALVAMLKDKQAPVQWAAVRAMAQIGGPDAKPAAAFMKDKLPNAPEVEQYNMMIYLSLLGPVAAEAAPTIRSTRLKNPVLPGATLWAISETPSLPWENSNGRGFGVPGGPGGGGPGGEGGPADLNSYMYSAYFRELGDRLHPVTQLFVQKLLDGTAGNVPQYGYTLLTADAEGSLETLTPKLADSDRTVRQRAAVALGYMNESAAPAKPQLEAAIAKATDEKEKRILSWTLRKIAGTK